MTTRSTTLSSFRYSAAHHDFHTICAVSKVYWNAEQRTPQLMSRLFVLLFLRCGDALCVRYRAFDVLGSPTFMTGATNMPCGWRDGASNARFAHPDRLGWLDS